MSQVRVNMLVNIKITGTCSGGFWWKFLWRDHFCPISRDGDAAARRGARRRLVRGKKLGGSEAIVVLLTLEEMVAFPPHGDAAGIEPRPPVTPARCGPRSPGGGRGSGLGWRSPLGDAWMYSWVIVTLMPCCTRRLARHRMCLCVRSMTANVRRCTSSPACC